MPGEHAIHGPSSTNRTMHPAGREELLRQRQRRSQNPSPSPSQKLKPRPKLRQLQQHPPPWSSMSTLPAQLCSQTLMSCAGAVTGELNYEMATVDQLSGPRSVFVARRGLRIEMLCWLSITGTIQVDTKEVSHWYRRHHVITGQRYDGQGRSSALLCVHSATS